MRGVCVELPLVSVIIPTYKRPDVLERAIDSVLNQTYERIEVIVVDDNAPYTSSRVETELVMGKYKGNGKVKYIQHPENRNGSAARNTGISQANGKYIAFLDDDDEFLERKLELQVLRLEELGESWGVCYTHFVRKKNGLLLDRGIEQREGLLTAEILKGSFYISAGSNLLVRKDLVETIGGFNESFPRRQDLEFLVRLSQLTQIACVPIICLVVHKDNSTSVIRTAESYLHNTHVYLESFSEYIDNLPVEQRKKVLVGQNLGIVRFYLAKGQFGNVYRVCKQNEISFFVFVRYLMYLVKRKVFKLCYGFRV
jgi:glycosyltransferase involved in cell wall biosynthesis